MKMQKFLALLLVCSLCVLAFLSCSGESGDLQAASESAIQMEAGEENHMFEDDSTTDFQIYGYDYSTLRNLARMAEEYDTEDFEYEDYYEDEETEYEYEDEEDVEDDYVEDESEDDEWEEDEY